MRETSVVAMSPIVGYTGVDRLRFDGSWEFVRGRRDGRFMGASARSYRLGSCMSIVFLGKRLRVFGVTGVNGGKAWLLLSPRAPQRISFQSSQRQVHRVLYDSGTLPDGIHSAGIVVVSALPERPEGYVNIDEVEITASH
jgi:hypothetical protein